MTTLRLMTSTACVLLCAGCTLPGPSERNALQAEFRATIPTCQTPQECERKWAAARNWVLQNAGMKIQHITPDYIETYNPPPSGTELAVRVTKDPNAVGGYSFLVRTWCNNFLGCHPDSWKAAVDFNRKISAVK